MCVVCEQCSACGRSAAAARCWHAPAELQPKQTRVRRKTRAAGGRRSRVQRHTGKLSTRDCTHHRAATVGSAAADHDGRRRRRRRRGPCAWPPLPQFLRICRLRRSRRSAAARASAGAHDGGLGGDAEDNMWRCSRCGARGGAAAAAAADLQSGGTHDAGLNLPRRMCEQSNCSRLTQALSSTCASQPADCGRFGSP